MNLSRTTITSQIVVSDHSSEINTTPIWF